MVGCLLLAVQGYARAAGLGRLLALGQGSCHPGAVLQSEDSATLHLVPLYIMTAWQTRYEAEQPSECPKLFRKLAQNPDGGRLEISE